MSSKNLVNTKDYIVVKGARENNLKNIDITIPKDKFVVITGLSGSGKSSLAFDTIYAEGQRRYLESLSSYARQFLGGNEKPDVDSIDGLSPSISIDQKTTSHNPRSTVGTVTEIYDYLRLLYARIGKPYCKNGHGLIKTLSTKQIVCLSGSGYLSTRHPRRRNPHPIYRWPLPYPNWCWSTVLPIYTNSGRYVSGLRDWYAFWWPVWCFFWSWPG